MPALLSNVENTELMAYNVKRGNPWHGLGEPVEEDMGIEHALRVSGSDDFVFPTTLYTRNEDGSYEEVDGRFQSIKSDKYGTLGVRSSAYEITQRREMLEIAYDITGLASEAAHIDTIGNLGDPPAVFFAYIRVPELVIDPNGIADKIERGLYVATSFDGTMKNVIGYSNIRVVCWNTLNMALKSSSQTIGVRHTKNSEERIHTAALALQYIGEVEKEVIAKAEAMLRVDGDKALDRMLNQFWPIDKSLDLSELALTRRNNARGAVRAFYEGEDNTAINFGGRTGWAAYNAVTEYIDHGMSVKVKDADRQRSQRALFPGTNVNMKLQASQLVLAD